jgi:DNA polymerase
MTARTAYPTAVSFLPERHTYEALRAAVQECRGCLLYLNATQAVFGEGPLSPEVMLVGERDRAYVTNAVKHFKWKASGPRRIHDKPSWSEQVACRPYDRRVVHRRAGARAR